MVFDSVKSEENSAKKYMYLRVHGPRVHGREPRIRPKSAGREGFTVAKSARMIMAVRVHVPRSSQP